MTDRVQIVLGTKRFLKTFFNSEQTPLLLMKPLAKGQNYGLLDVHGQVRFAAPMVYDPLAMGGDIQDQGFIQLAYFRLTDDEAPVFIDQFKALLKQREQLQGNLALGLLVKKAKERDYLVISQWERTLDVFASKSTPLWQPVNKFAERAAKGLGYHDANYQVISPNAPDTDDEQAQAATSATN
ncbi:antibiotic biosynthesis monooxygenase [Lacticaseibacillus sp. N501-2]|uniref:antibiotic biosynthesis monooxygenase n=1 Tax=Lacticaseibacillus salsurae TaxID=3367729 RepID=UPI0038B37068